MTDYPSPEHASAVRRHVARAVRELDEMTTRAALLRRRIEAGDFPFATDATGLAVHAATIIERISALDTLRDVQEWHEAGQSGAGSASQAGAAGDAQPYSGPRYCLFCGSRARWDVSGFLSCSSSVHLGRARDALAARREQEDASEEGAAAELARKHNVIISGSTGVQYGDGNSQSNIFGGQ